MASRVNGTPAFLAGLGFGADAGGGVGDGVGETIAESAFGEAETRRCMGEALLRPDAAGEASFLCLRGLLLADSGLFATPAWRALRAGDRSDLAADGGIAVMRLSVTGAQRGGGKAGRVSEVGIFRR